MRAHAHLDTKRREPYLFDEADRKLMRDAVRSRYSLLPFWYTSFYHSTITGSPIMRPLWFEFPEDEECFAEEDTFMVDTALLVAPALDQGATSVNVYFPGTGPWYDTENLQVRVVQVSTFELIGYRCTLALSARHYQLHSARFRYFSVEEQLFPERIAFVVLLSSWPTIHLHLWLPWTPRWT